MSGPVLVAIGDNCLDAYFDRDRLLVGGNALNVAAHWRAQGRAARYFGVVGDDPEAALLLAAAARAGLDPADIEARAGPTAVTLLAGEAAERRFLLESLGVGEGYVPSAERYAAARDAAWTHLGTNPAPDLVRRLVEDGVPFSVDLSTRPFDLPIGGVPLVLASAAAAEAQALLAQLRRRGARQALVTAGAAGAWLDDGARVWRVEAQPAEVVDTCGAGDAFVAAFLAARVIDAAGPAEALEAGTRAGAAVCGHLGGFPQAPQPLPAWLRDRPRA